MKLSESPSDHSTISRTRRLIDVATHEAVFDWVLKRIGASGLLRGKTIGIDATTLEANAALRSIVRRDSEQGYEEFLMELAKASGLRRRDGKIWPNWTASARAKDRTRGLEAPA